MSEEFGGFVDLFDDSDEHGSKESSMSSKEEVSSEVYLPDVQESSLVKLSESAGVTVPREKYEIIEHFMARARYGHQAALPMKCKAKACPFLGMCPLETAKLELPLGKDCPVEQALVQMWVNKTLGALNIDPEDPEYAVDIDMVYELAGMELLRMRAGHHMSTSPSLVEEKIVGYSPQGQPIYDEKPKVALLILEKYSKVVNKLREQLLATRKSQAQAGQLAGDVSVRTANIMSRAKKIAEARRAGIPIADADFSVKPDEEQKT